MDLNRIEGDIGRATLTVGGETLKAADIEPGKLYYAPALGITGKIVDGPDNRGNCVLQSGSIKVNVSVDALRLPSAARPGKAPVSRSEGRRRSPSGNGAKLSMDRHLHMGSEIQLLGQTVEEAQSNLDKFIDDAVLAGIHSIRIVHGKGTGALRSAVQQMLKRDKRVREFRLGAYGEGDSGVTLADLS